MRRNYTHIVMVIDESGSMAPQRDDTIGGVNTFIAEQKEHPRDFWTGDRTLPAEKMVRADPPMKGTISLYTFGGQVRQVYAMKHLASAPNLTSATYKPSGFTPLLDALGRAITETGDHLRGMRDDERPDKVIVLIVTDGHENASITYSKDQIARMVREQRDIYKWDFVFIGADINAIDEAAQYGISGAAAMQYDKGSTHSTYAVASANVMRSRVTGQSMAFNDADRDIAMGGDPGWLPKQKTKATDDTDSGKKEN
jgi:uncharacterized protein YegL